MRPCGLLTWPACTYVSQHCLKARPTAPFRSFLCTRFDSSRHRNPRGRALTRAAAPQDTADRIPSVKQQAAEHRKHVLARFQPPGVIVVQVAVRRSGTLFPDSSHRCFLLCMHKSFIDAVLSVICRVKKKRQEIVMSCSPSGRTATLPT